MHEIRNDFDKECLDFDNNNVDIQDQENANDK